MHAITVKTVIVSLAAVATVSGGGAQPIPEPDVVLYGGILLGGSPVPPVPATTVAVFAVPEGENPAGSRLDTYTICNNCNDSTPSECSTGVPADNCIIPNALVDADGDGQVDDAGYVLRLRMEYLPMGAVQSAGAVIQGDIVDLWIENPPGTFQAMGSYTVAGRGTVALADLPLTGGPCPGDINGDGNVSILDFLALLIAWGPNPGHPADLNGDGNVTILDFLALLIAWGPCD